MRDIRRHCIFLKYATCSIQGSISYFFGCYMAHCKSQAPEWSLRMQTRDKRHGSESQTIFSTLFYHPWINFQFIHVPHGEDPLACILCAGEFSVLCALVPINLIHSAIDFRKLPDAPAYMWKKPVVYDYLAPAGFSPAAQFPLVVRKLRF